MKFKITWGSGRYSVDIPNYEGGEVVTRDEYDELLMALKDVRSNCEAAAVGHSTSGSWQAVATLADKAIIKAESR